MADWAELPTLNPVLGVTSLITASPFEPMMAPDSPLTQTPYLMPFKRNHATELQDPCSKLAGLRLEVTVVMDWRSF